MSNEFYDYIALTVLTYFQSQAEAISPGSRYCLKLDTPDIVENVYNSLSSVLEKKSIKGSFDYHGVYQTYTLRLKENKELVIAAKVGEITDDFFTSLRNNDLTENCFPILIITHSTIDSITSGTADLSAKGMPFHAETLIKGLSKDIQETPFCLYDKTLLETQLEEHVNDRFSEKSSLLVYSDVITLVNKGRLDQEDYYALGYFPDENVSKYNKKDIEENLKENRKYFELIDRAVKFKNFSQIEELFNPKFVQKLQKSLDKQEHWYCGVTIQDIREALLRQKETIVITPDDIDIFFDIETDRLIRNEDFFVKTDGETKAKSRKLNVLIFNSQAKKQLIIEVRLQKKGQLKKSDVDGQGLEVAVSSWAIKATIEPNGVTFGSIIIKDPGNSKKSHQIKIAVLDIDKHILREVRTIFSIGFRGRKIEKSKIVLKGVSETLTLNSVAPTISKGSLADGATYNVSKDQGLHLQIEDSSFDSNTGSADFTLKIGSLILPMELESEKSRPNVLTGIKAFLLKHKKQESIEYAENRLITGTDAYTPSDDFKQSLVIENFIVKNGSFAVKEDINGLENRELELPENVKQAYHNLIEELRKAKTLPSLASLKGCIKGAAEVYLATVLSTLKQFKEGQTLSTELCNLLCIGSVITRQGLRLSPLHPLNIAYQLELMKEEGLGDLKEYMVEKLTCINLLPYLRPFNNQLCHAVYHSHSPEWLDYIPISEKSFSGGKNFVPKLVKKKITDYLENFKFLFDDVSNPLIKLNLVGMGDCADVLSGITEYYKQEISDETAPEDLKSFEINIYEEEGIGFNQFSILSSPRKLKAYIGSIVPKAELFNEMYTILTSHIHCFFHSIEEEQFAYAHICFYEMPNSGQIGYSRMDNINTGISLNGLVSGVPSVLDQEWHKTGFGTKYAKENKLTKFAKLLNAAQRVAFTGSTFNFEEAIFTQISQNNQDNLEKLYKTSNWVVFVSPKVDLSYFYEGHSKDLMIIHYSDQFSSTSGYDDITVTDKSGQYKEIIKEKFSQKGIKNIDGDQISQLIRFFNSINGEWLLKLISSKAPSNNFSREKMSILSAIKLLMNYFSHSDILWVPLSLEELLRVSKGAGYRETEGLLSARNLGFQNGPTCDDLLMVGFYVQNGKVKLCLHPVEVKIGENHENVLSKAKLQAKATYTGLMNALNPSENKDFLEHRLSRNFFAQQLIANCEKLNIYSSLPGRSWKDILDTYRTQLLNDEYEISTSLEAKIGKATVVSFKFNAEKHLLAEGAIKQITIPEERGFKLLIQNDSEIKAYLEEVQDTFVLPLVDCKLSELPEISDIQFDDSNFVATNTQESDQESENQRDGNGEEDDNVGKVPEGKGEGEEAKNDNPAEVISDSPRSMRIRFGTDIATGNPVNWYPNDTEMVFHTNTGIIGTMGTGKTQFTKSLVSQMIHNQADNFAGDPLGILIFDYKGDYNENNEDFFNATQAKIFKPYHLPFNPFSLIRGKVTKPLLPKHVGNAFVTTLARIYNLGAKQTNALGQCITEAYELKGIFPGNPSTWDREAPTFNTVYDCYLNNQEIKKADSLASVMTKLFDFEIFEPDPKRTKSLFEVLNGVVVIDMSGYDTDIQNLIVAITLDLFYAQMFTEGSSKLDNRYRQLTRMILVDEADNFMSKGFPSLKKIMKEGREFGVGVILSTQFLKHFGTSEDDYSKYILTWVVHCVADLKERDIDFIFKTEPKSQESAKLFNDVKALTKHHSIVKIGNNKPQYLKDFAFWEYLAEGAEKCDSTKG